MKGGSRILLALLLLAFATVVNAHEVRPAYLEVRQSGTETFQVFWKVPAKGELRLGLSAVLPTNCEIATPISRHMEGGAYTERWMVDCPDGIAGRRIGIDGLAATMTDVLVRLEWLDGTTQITRLMPSSPAFFVSATPSLPETGWTYLRLGIEHILLGIDHLLFVLGLLMLVRGWRRLLATVTAFTVAHSITLAAATLGLVRLPPQPVEAVIALSIVFVAAEILRSRRGRQGLTERLPWLIAFMFGLLHGLGFAGALREIGLPDNGIAVALLFFNLGVEVGQLVFIAGIVGLYAAVRRLAARFPFDWFEHTNRSRAVEITLAYSIDGVATFWTIERVQGFWA